MSVPNLLRSLHILSLSEKVSQCLFLKSWLNFLPDIAPKTKAIVYSTYGQIYKQWLADGNPFVTQTTFYAWKPLEVSRAKSEHCSL